MLPKINVIPTPRKTISLNKRAINKINSTSTLNNFNTSKTKRYTAESPHNKVSSNISKRSRILNISTKNNTSNNSNFNDNLYFYPPHNKKFSYVSNLSSEVVLLYGDFNFNKAPSLSQNFSGIRKIIQDKRSDKMKYLDNLFSLSIFGNKFTKTISANNIINSNNNKEITNPISTMRGLSFNNSCGELNIKNKDKEKMENLKSHKIIRYINSENKNYSPYKTISPKETFSNNNNDKLESLNNYPSTTNQETIKFPGISKKEMEEKGDSKYNTSRIIKNNSFITDLNTKKMNFELNDCIFESGSNIKNVYSFAKKILHMKIFQGFQKTTLNSFLDKNFIKLRKYINHIETNFEKYMNICKIYNYDFSRYMEFLKRKVREMGDENKSLSGREMQLGFDVDNIITANVRKQRELEKLIDMRNFLYIVRHKDEKIPNIYSTFYIESKRYLLAKLFLKLFGDLRNITVIKYLMTIPDPIPDINSVDSSEFIVEQSPPLVKETSITASNESNSSKESNKNIFTSHDEFISIMKYLEEQNRALLNEDRKRLNLIEKYKEILENSITPDDIEFEGKLMKNIELNEKELNIIKKKNLLLLQKYNYYHNLNKSEDLFTQKNPSKKREDEKKSSFQDLGYFQTVNYNFLIKKAKFHGLVFFQKLLKNYLNTIKLLSNEMPYYKIHPEYLDEIIDFSLNAENNEKFNIFLNRYILKLLQLYEYVYDYIYKKHQLYKLEEKNIKIMKKQKDIISEKRKLDNARTLRKLIEKKRLNANILLVEKWKMPPKYIGKGNYIGNFCRNLFRAKSRENILKKKKIVKNKISMNDDLNDLLFFDE